MYQQMAECRRCGWLGPADARQAKHDRAAALYCPTCGHETKTWVVDQGKAQADLIALSRERAEKTQIKLEAYRAMRQAGERLQEAQAHLKRCQAGVLLQAANDPSDRRQAFEQQRRLLAAEREAAEAALACRQATATVKAMGER
jgi:uncharacterized Zn finger protein (UPF0148 family)